MFPDELPRVILDREGKFSIELLSGTTHIAPYKTTPSELREIRVQLQDFLENSFIQPSVSSWGPQFCL